MLPISFFVVPVIPRRMVRDSSGNLIPYFDSVGYLGMTQEVLGFVAPISVIWTLSAGFVGLVRYFRIHRAACVNIHSDEEA